MYLGAPNAAEYAPAGSFINALEHTPKQLALLLKRLNADSRAYAEYFEWQLGASDGILQHFGHLLGDDRLLGRRGNGLEWVCKVCQMYSKYYDWRESVEYDTR